MIQIESELHVADNSGAKLVLCIKILEASKVKYAFIGSLIKVAVKKCLFRGKVKKGDIYNAVLVRSKSRISRIDGSYLNFNFNSVVLLNNKFESIGTRISGPLPKELKDTKFAKLLSLAPEII